MFSFKRKSKLKSADFISSTVDFRDWLFEAKKVIEENSETIKRLEHEKSKLIDQLDKLEQKINNNANSSLPFRNEAVEFHKLIKELEQKQVENEEIKEINNILEHRLNQAKYYLENEKKKHEQSELEKNQLYQEISRQKDVINNLHNKISDFREREKEEKARVDELEQSIKNTFSDRSQKEILAERAEIRINFLKEKNKELEQNQEELLKKIIHMENDRTLVAGLESLEDNWQTKERIKDLEAQIREKNEQIFELGRQLDELTKDEDLIGDERISRDNLQQELLKAEELRKSLNEKEDLLVKVQQKLKEAQKTKNKASENQGETEYYNFAKKAFKVLLGIGVVFLVIYIPYWFISKFILKE